MTTFSYSQLSQMEKKLYDRWTDCVFDSPDIESTSTEEQLQTAIVKSASATFAACPTSSSSSPVISHQNNLHLVKGSVSRIFANNSRELNFMLDDWKGNLLPVRHFKWPHNTEAMQKFESELWESALDRIGSTTIDQDPLDDHSEPYSPENYDMFLAQRSSDTVVLPPMEIVFDRNRAAQYRRAAYIHDRLMSNISLCEQMALEEFARHIYQPQTCPEPDASYGHFVGAFRDYIDQPGRLRLATETKTPDSICLSDEVECIGFFTQITNCSRLAPSLRGFFFCAGNVRNVHPHSTQTEPYWLHRLKHQLRMALVRERSSSQLTDAQLQY